MPTDAELRTAFIVAFGSRCERCGEQHDPRDLIIHHTKRRVGFGGDRMREIQEWFATRVRPEGIEIICDTCNRKEHHYKPRGEQTAYRSVRSLDFGRNRTVSRRLLPGGEFPSEPTQHEV
jgi:hypothetical protein